VGDSKDGVITNLAVKRKRGKSNECETLETEQVMSNEVASIQPVVCANLQGNSEIHEGMVFHVLEEVKPHRDSALAKYAVLNHPANPPLVVYNSRPAWS